MKIIEYKLIGKSLSSDLNEAVNSHIAEGWHPYGFPYSANTYHYQTVVKYDTTTPAACPLCGLLNHKGDCPH